MTNTRKSRGYDSIFEPFLLKKVASAITRFLGQSSATLNVRVASKPVERVVI